MKPPFPLTRAGLLKPSRSAHVAVGAGSRLRRGLAELVAGSSARQRRTEAAQVISR